MSSSSAPLGVNVRPCNRSRGRGAPRLSLGAVVGVLVITAYRLRAVREATFPGHEDTAFYFTTAENLADGRGFVIDYVWHFLVPHEDLTHFAFDYWLPGHSLLMAAALRAFGGGLPTALSVAVVLAGMFAFATAMIAHSITDVRWISPVAAVIVIVLPPVNSWSVSSDASVAYWAVGAWAFAISLRARERPRLWLTAGALAGLAHLCRNDGLLLATAVVACAAAWSPGARLRRAGATAAGYLVVFGPWAILSVVELGSPLPPATRVFPFVTEYLDIYRLPPLPGVADLRSLGVRGNIDLRLDALRDRCSDLVVQNGRVLTAAVLVMVAIAVTSGWLRWRQRRRDGAEHRAWSESPWLLPAVYGSAFSVMNVIVIPVVPGEGGWARSAPLIYPFFVTGALIGVARTTRRPVIQVALVAVLIVPPLLDLAPTTREVIRRNNAEGQRLATIALALDEERDCVDGEIIVMTGFPWQLTQATGYRSVVVPHESLDAVLREAKRWNVTHLLDDYSSDTSTLIRLGSRRTARCGAPGPIRSFPLT